MAEEAEAEAEYYSKDFEWEDLRREVENDPSLRYHLAPFVPSSSCAATAVEADAWRSFHRRHSAGKFFKERRYLLKEFPELIRTSDSIKVLEVGCGNGSTVLPILRNSCPEPANFSSDSRGENLEMSHMSTFLREDQCCIGGVDFVTMIFTLSNTFRKNALGY